MTRPASRRIEHPARFRALLACLGGILSAGLVAGVSVTPATAKPAHLKALAEHYGPFLPARLNNCTTCHLPSTAKAPASLAEFPHNPFGMRLAALREPLEAAGKRADLASRLKAVAAE